MARKEIYAAIELATHEVRLLVGEFFESHLNIQRVERVKCSGIENNLVVNEQNVVGAIMKACANASNALGYPIQRVLLVVPSVNVVRQTSRTIVTTSGKVRLSDIQRGINDLVNVQAPGERELVNLGGIKYAVNGINSRKMPLNESTTQFKMECDLFFADRSILYSFARCIEKANLEIMDIVLDAYAIGEEAAIFEKTIENYIVLVNLERQTTTMSLFSQGRLLNSEVLYEGYGNWVEPLKNSTGIKSDACIRLVMENATMEENASSQPIFLWADKDHEKTLSVKDVNDLVLPEALKWKDKIVSACEQITALGNTRMILTGEGCEIVGMKKLAEMMNVETSIYVPQTIGARNSAYSAVLGAFYSWKDINTIRNNHACLCQMDLIEASLQTKTKEDEEHGFTKKLMKIIMNDK